MEDVLSRVAQMTVRGDVQVQCDLESLAGVRVQGDPTWLRQAFLYLLSNAVKFSPVGGVLWFECVSDQDQLIFKISDAGLENSSEPQKALFGSFHPRVLNSAKRDSGRDGFSILKPLLEMMGGSIRVESIAGKGNLFSIILPKGERRHSRLRPPSGLLTHSSK